MTRIISALLILLAASAHAQVIGVLSNLLATAATPAELTETVLELNSIVINAGDMHDLRVGDGVTPGGVRVWNTDALTEPPRSYPHGFAMNGNTISLNGSYTIGAEGPLWYLRCNGSNVMSVLANSGSLGTTISETYAGSNILRVVVAVEDEALDPLVEYSQSLITPAWTDCVYTVTRPTTNLVQIDIEIPEDATNGYFRITALSGFRVRFGIPLEAPSASVSGGLTLGGTTNVITDDGTNLTRNGVLIAGTGGTGSGFPATNHMNAAGYNLTNLNIAQGTTANFGTLNATTVNGTIFNGRDMTLSGNLNIASNLNYTINQQTTVYLGTNYITNINVTARWTTNNTYLYTNVVETHTAWYTNYVTYDTYINNGGYFNASNANWVAFPGLYIEGTNTAASGVWDFTDAIVLGLGAGTVTNAGYGLIMTNNVIAIDTSIVATGTPLYVYSETDPAFAASSNLFLQAETDPAFTNWLGTNTYIKTESDPVWASEKSSYATGTPLYVYSETDPAFTNWVETTFTNAVTSLVAQVSVAGVSSVEGITGAVLISGATNSGQTIYLPASSGATQTNTITDTMTQPLRLSGGFYVGTDTNLITNVVEGAEGSGTLTNIVINGTMGTTTGALAYVTVAGGGGGISGIITDATYTNDMSVMQTVTNTYTLTPVIEKIVLRAETTNRPFSKSVIVDLFHGATIAPEARQLRESFTFEAVDLQTNVTSGDSEIGIIQAQQLYDDDLCYLSDNASTSEYVRILSSVDSGSWNTDYDSTEADIYSLAVYDGKLYAGSATGGKVFVYDGTTWSESYDSTEGYIYSLAVYGGKLYAGSGTGGKVFVYDGSTWSESYDSTEGYILSLAVYDGKLYAGSGTGGKVYVYDGTTWSESYDSTEERIYSLAVYGGKLYAGSGAGGIIFRYTSTGLTTLVNPLANSYAAGSTMYRCAEMGGWVATTNCTLRVQTVSETLDYDVISIFKEVQ